MYILCGSTTKDLCLWSFLPRLLDMLASLNICVKVADFLVILLLLQVFHIHSAKKNKFTNMTVFYTIEGNVPVT